MRSIARTFTAALPLLVLMPAPVLAQGISNVPVWETTTADDDGSPMALFPLEANTSVGQLKLLCGEKRGLQLRIDMKAPPRPTSVTIANARGEKVVLTPDREGNAKAAQLDALRQLYERTTGMAGDDEPKERVPFTITSNQETALATYNFRRFGHTLVWMNTACTDWRKPAAPVAAKSPPPARSAVAAEMVRYCERWIYGRSCGCIVNDMITASARSPLQIANQSDKMFQLWQGYQEAQFNGALSFTMSTQLPRYAQQLGVPPAQADQFVVETLTAIKTAAARCRGK